MEWKYGHGLPPGMQIYEDEKFSMREFGLWTVNGAQKERELEDDDDDENLPKARITKDQLEEESDDDVKKEEFLVPSKQRMS